MRNGSLNDAKSRRVVSGLGRLEVGSERTRRSRRRCLYVREVHEKSSSSNGNHVQGVTGVISILPD